MWGGWCSGEKRDSFGTSLWKEIRKDWTTILDNDRFFNGDGRRVRFWKDNWCGEEALGRSFSTFFNMAVNKDALVRDV